MFCSTFLTRSEPNGKLASSHLGHRLTAYAQEHKPEVAADLAMKLMNNYQVLGKSPSDRDELAAIATKFGLFPDQSSAKAWLNTDDKDAQVQREYKEALQAGISGVPFFIFNDKYATSGAVGVPTFEATLEKIASL